MLRFLPRRLCSSMAAAATTSTATPATTTSTSVAETRRKARYTISRLTNGLRVITADDGTGVTGVSLFNQCAPYAEDESTAGASAVMECLVLAGNERHSPQEISEYFERTGNSFKMLNLKECVGYFLMAPRYHVKETLEVLAGMALHPAQDAERFQQALEGVRLSAEIFQRDATRVCFENVYAAGWGHAGVGVPQLPAPEVASKLTQENFNRFHRRCTRPETTVVAATGVSDHAAFVRLVEQSLVFHDCGPPPQLPPAPYRGGTVMTEQLEAPETTLKFAEKSLTHMCMVLPTVPLSHPDYYVYSVIQTVLGGGASFSSGGPGKGIHTKLFREVINREGWINGIESVTGWFQCGSVLGLYGSAPHDWNQHLHRMMVYQLAGMSQRVTPAMLEMAKNQLASQLVLLGEGREQSLEEMGRNLLMFDHVQTSSDLMAGASKVTIEDMHRACRKAVDGQKLSTAVYGSLDGLPNETVTNAQLQAAFRKLNGI